MAYQVKVAFSPAAELITSLYIFTCKKMLKRIDLGPEWVKTVKSSLTESFSSELVQADIWLELNILAVQYQDVQEFLKWLDEVSPGEIYEKLSPYVFTFPKNLAETKERMVYLLTEWNEQYFQHFDQSILTRLNEEAERQKNVIENSPPIKFGESLTNGITFEPIEGLEKILYIPQFHAQPSHLFQHYGGITVCEYSPNIYEEEVGDPARELQQITKALSDKSRLKILRYLAKAPSSFIEVVRHMGLARSTVHDHLIILRTAGLIRVSVQGENLSSYTFRDESLDHLRSQLELFILEK